MRRPAQRRAFAVGLVICLGWLTAHAADSADPDLLEFLGSVDSPDQNWQAYLARQNPAPPPPPPPSAPAPHPTPAVASPATPPAPPSPPPPPGDRS